MTGVVDRMTYLPILQAVACFVIAAAGLVPVFHENLPFWGLTYFVFDGGAPTVLEVDDDSPASTAGLREADVILEINGATADTSVDHILEGLQPGETARLRVRRGATNVELAVTGVEPPLAHIYYASVWYPVAGVTGLALGLIVFAPQPMRPAPRWRAAMLGVAGFALAIIFSWPIVDNDVFAHLIVWQFHVLNWGTKWHFEQNWVGFIASLSLTVLGICELRGLLRRSAAAQIGPPNKPPQQAGPV